MMNALFIIFGVVCVINAKAIVHGPDDDESDSVDYEKPMSCYHYEYWDIDTWTEDTKHIGKETYRKKGARTETCQTHNSYPEGSTSGCVSAKLDFEVVRGDQETFKGTVYFGGCGRATCSFFQRKLRRALQVKYANSLILRIVPLKGCENRCNKRNCNVPPNEVPEKEGDEVKYIGINGPEEYKGEPVDPVAIEESQSESDEPRK